MIKKRTVFVLGAGANVPYGFSTGGKLLETARAKTIAELEQLTGERIHPYQLKPLHDALAANLLPSIDAMLEHRKDLWAAGKQVMAALLYAEEARAARSITPTADDWISLIFENMCTDADSTERFASNPVSFITFNYDRLLEHRIARGVSARYSLDDRTAWNVLQPIPFLHLHGSLGLLPGQDTPGSSAEVVPFGPQKRTGVDEIGYGLSVAEKTVKIIHDADPKHPVFTEAQNLFAAADHIFFFGFGFGKTNVERLGTRAIHPHKFIFCTTFDMTPAEIVDSVDTAFQDTLPQRIQKSSSSIRQFLRDRIGLLR